MRWYWSLQAIKILLERSRDLQKEIVAQGRVSVVCFMNYKSPTGETGKGNIGLHSVRPSVCLSVRHTRFPDFSSLCFQISGWKLVASFHMKSYRSSSTFVTVDLLFHELLPFVQKSFSGLFSAMLSHIWMKVDSKLPYEELQIKLDFCHGWPTFSWIIALCSKIVFRTFLGYAFLYMNESW